MTSTVEHSGVEVNQPMRPGQNRFRLSCGYYVDCCCQHAISSLAWCLQHGKMERVIYSAVSVWNPETCAYGLVYDREETDE